MAYQGERSRHNNVNAAVGQTKSPAPDMTSGARPFRGSPRDAADFFSDPGRHHSATVFAPRSHVSTGCNRLAGVCEREPELARLFSLLLHACELALKGYCRQCVVNGQTDARAANHDLKGWYEIARRYGCASANQHTLDAFDTLTELHRHNYARYPDNRRGPIPDISHLANDVVDWLISAVSPVVQQG